MLGGDNAGFPNGRRPGDDVVDIELRVAMGVLCHASPASLHPADAPSGKLPFTDGALQDASQFDAAVPLPDDAAPRLAVAELPGLGRGPLPRPSPCFHL